MNKTKIIVRNILWVFNVIFFLVYFIYYDSFKEVLGIVINIAPPLIFIFGSILIADKYNDIIKIRRRRGEPEEIIYITYFDAMKNDMLAFLAAAAILAVPVILFKQNLNLADILQAIIAFSAIYYVRVYYFNKINRY